MGYELSGDYNVTLVLLSFGIAVLASYTTWDLAGRLQGAKERMCLWLVGGAVAMGTGIWSMHFIAMLGFRLPLEVNYDLWTTLLSLVYIAPIFCGNQLWGLLAVYQNSGPHSGKRNL